MAESDLIDGYLADLRRQIRWRGDVDDVIDEVEDHLRETAANLTAAGVDEREAQRRTLVRFGDPAIIHRVFSTSPSGGVVMPTAFTRTAGAVAFLAAPLWIAATVLKWWESGLFAPWSQDRFVAYSVVAASATLLALIVMLGMLARVGWPRPTSGVAIGLALLGLIGMAGVTWMWPVLGLFLGPAFLLTTLAVTRAVERFGRLTWAAPIGWFAGFMVFALLSGVGLGPVDEYGGFPMAEAVGFSVVAAGMVIGMLDVGRWLVTEHGTEPVTDPSRVAVA